MRQASIAFALTVAAALAPVAARSLHGQAGPGEDGAVFRDPFAEPTQRAPAPRASAQSAAPAAAAIARAEPTPSERGPRETGTAFDQILAKLAVDPRLALNRDIQPTPDLGPWMICVHSYVTKEAPQWAREMAGELRTAYQLPAYVFTYGLEDRRKEFERVKELVDRQRSFQNDKDLPIMYAPSGRGPSQNATARLSDDLPLEYASRLLRVQHYPVQCAVLVGGYPSEDAAVHALKSIKKLRPPDPNKVSLDKKFYVDPTAKNPQAKGEEVYVNPFPRAFLCRNPAVKQEQKKESADDLDIKVLRKFNADEPYSLLQCRKSYTLAIKEFRTFTVMQDKETSPSVLEKFGFNSRAGAEGIDQAGHDAHNLAEVLRKMKLETYVLHTKFSSIVTVGSYDGVDDPDLRAMQNLLANRFNSPDWALVRMFARPMPMQVPR